MQAIILAAGMGKRLRHKTKDNTKCMVEVNGRRLIDRSLDNITAFPVSRIVIVIGYEGQKLREHVGESWNGIPVIYVENPVYASTNNIYSLSLAKDYLAEEDTLLFESDLIYEPSIIQRLLDDPNPNVAVVDKYNASMDGTVVTISEQNDITAFIPKKYFDYRKVEDYYKTVNIYKFSRSFLLSDYIPFLTAYSTSMGNNQYYEQVLRVLLVLEKEDMKALPLSGEKWYEIDDLQDLSNAELIFNEDGAGQLEAIRQRRGGYWRFNGILDFSSSVNPCFPPRRMIEEFKYSFVDLLENQPSGQDTQNLLAGNIYDVLEENILVGNGSAELIAALMPQLPGRVGMMLPSMQEYPARVVGSGIVDMLPKGGGVSYSAQELMDAAGNIDTLCLMNPDNPSGNFISLPDMKRLIAHYGAMGKKIVVDESLVDFSTEGEANSLLHQDLLEANPNLVVVKSLGEGCGVPGLRLGIIASGDTALLAAVRRRLPQGNINSFSEYFLQIMPKYRDACRVACSRMAGVRDAFVLRLAEVPGLTVFPSQANYCLCKVEGRHDAASLCLALLEKHNILIRDCSAEPGLKGGSFVRVAVRSEQDNDLLLQALHALMA